MAMPFAAIRPAMGASLLVSHLRGVGVSARVEYLNMGFARLLGPTDYGYISDRAPTQSLAGDWVFSASLFGERPAADAAYAAAFRERFGRYGPCDEPLAMLGRARAQASTFIDACLDQVEWTNYDLVGFTSSFTQHVASLAIFDQSQVTKIRTPRIDDSNRAFSSLRAKSAERVHLLEKHRQIFGLGRCNLVTKLK